MIKTKPTFILDGMLGSLARWLRLLGFDVLYCKDRTDDEILSIVNDRILLTRDKELLVRAQNQGFKAFNPGPPPITQMLRWLQERLRLSFNIDPDQSRCSLCNSRLSPARPNDVRNDVPPKSFRHQRQFWQCTNQDCQKVYWQGRHWRRIRLTLRDISNIAS